MISSLAIRLSFPINLLGFRLHATVLKVVQVASKYACIDECFADPCCRSINYKNNPLENKMKTCEILHDLLKNATLEADTSYDHVFFIDPQKVVIMRWQLIG